MAERRRVKVDAHTHTGYSADSRTALADQARAVKIAGIDVICATDHNTIEGALRLRELADGFRVIVGEEINTREGELIGLFLERAVPRGLAAEETIARIHDQGGLVVIPHPFSRNRRYRIRRAALERIWPLVDAVEVFNAREAFAGDNRRAAEFARERSLVGTAGSDAHRAAEVGGAYLTCDDFAGREDFLAAVSSGEIHGRLAGYGVHFLTRWDRLRNLLGRGSSR